MFAYRKDLDRWVERQVRQGAVAEVDQRFAAIQESRDNLFAIRQRLKSWRRASQQIKRSGDEFEKNRQNRFRFMSTDLDAGLTLARIAERASDPRKRTRNETNARRALDTVLELRRASALTVDEDKVLEEKIADLRAALERLASRAMH